MVVLGVSTMNYIVIDLEFNGRRHYEIYPMEIIEIGAVKLNERLAIIDTFQSYIRPQFHINRFALQFCGISKDTLTGSRPFTEVIEEFIAFCGTDSTLLSWGGNDFFSLFVDCKVNRVDSSWLTRMIDLTSFFRGGLQQELANYGLQPIGQHHSALDDALNAAQLLRVKPDIVHTDRRFVPNAFKLCTGGIKKYIAQSIDRADVQGAPLSWDRFLQDEQTVKYIAAMNLDDAEIDMIRQLFAKFMQMKYGRKYKKLLYA